MAARKTRGARRYARKIEGMSKLLISDQEYALQAQAIEDQKLLARLENDETER